MPTYEYKCDACGHAFERFHSITAAPIKRCPKCGKAKVRRLIGAGAGMIFKGSGFYITDYRSESYQTAAKADNGGKVETKVEGKTETKTESKAEGKPESKSEAKVETKTEAKPTESKSESKPAPKIEQKASKSAKKR